MTGLPRKRVVFGMRQQRHTVSTEVGGAVARQERGKIGDADYVEFPTDDGDVVHGFVPGGFGGIEMPKGMVGFGDIAADVHEEDRRRRCCSNRRNVPEFILRFIQFDAIEYQMVVAQVLFRVHSPQQGGRETEFMKDMTDPPTAFAVGSKNGNPVMICDSTTTTYLFQGCCETVPRLEGCGCG